MKIKKILMFLGVTIGVISSFQINSKAASDWIYAAPKKTNFYMTKKTIHTTNGYFKDTPITIPKGTIFSYYGVNRNGKSQLPFLEIDTSQLGWPVRKPLATSKHNQMLTKGIWAKKSLFKIVSTPSYLKFYDNQNARKVNRHVSGPIQFWKGSKYIDGSAYETNQIVVTTDGYLEYTQPYNIYDRYNKQPLGYAKILQTIQKNGTLYYYYNSKINGIPATRLSGKYKYRTSVKKTGIKRVTVIPRGKPYFGDDSYAVSNIFSIGGQSFYTIGYFGH
ncbi:hypothetical protein [Lentilactobacillus kosonis]|uniref:Uncharacterized protein n=1 Tax=Lentilactobacillus kosonis TaxID=2810561 RepID=A0A401FNL1_9LACO|nr:hypothetical protein [Lentilactobacillus kosonis]GAY73927.1 hypothetical protein NBRC111893_2073 [Lentilactobacillus kosonis]